MTAGNNLSVTGLEGPNDSQKITEEQLEPYLTSRRRSVPSLLAAAYHYFDIGHSEGEMAALRWLKQSEAQRAQAAAIHR